MHPDRLFPPDRVTRDLARRLYDHVKEAPIVSPHGHVDARLLLDDLPFPDPSTLLIRPDHYVTRMLHAHGVPLHELGLPASREIDHVASRRVWRLFCERWDAFIGTPVRFWLESQLDSVFGIRPRLTAAAADAVYDELVECLARPEFRPRQMFDRFRIETLATTDDPIDSLEAHQRLRAEGGLGGAVIPTFRPDRYIDPSAPAWGEALRQLSEATGFDAGTYVGTLEALRDRRRYFIANGATSVDVGVRTPDSEPLDVREAERVHRRVLRGEADAADIARYRANMVFRQAEMSVDDGLTMQLHAGVLRHHHRPTLAEFGSDTGHDLPVRTDFVEPLRPLLEAFGTAPTLRLVLFTVDETAFSREIAPLAGFYPAVYAGAPWWFLDTPAAMERYRRAATDSAGIFKTSGFIDDTRAFCSIPARHDMARRVDAGFLASLVVGHQIDEETAFRSSRAIVGDLPRHVFNLPASRSDTK